MKTENIYPSDLPNERQIWAWCKRNNVKPDNGTLTPIEMARESYAGHHYWITAWAIRSGGRLAYAFYCPSTRLVHVSLHERNESDDWRLGAWRQAHG